MHVPFTSSTSTQLAAGLSMKEISGNSTARRTGKGVGVTGRRGLYDRRLNGRRSAHDPPGEQQTKHDRQNHQAGTERAVSWRKALPAKAGKAGSKLSRNLRCPSLRCHEREWCNHRFSPNQASRWRLERRKPPCSPAGSCYMARTCWFGKIRCSLPHIQSHSILQSS